MKTGFIGCGNMAGAIIEGAVKEGFIAKDISAFDIDGKKAEALSKSLSICRAESEKEIIHNNDIIVLSVKPHIIKSVLAAVKDNLDAQKHTIVSIAAGVSLDALEGFAEIPGLPIIRVMPNMNISVSKGMTALCANGHVKGEVFDFIFGLFNKVGKAIVLEEHFFPIFSALAGSSPAFSYLFIESLAKAAHKAGLPKDKAIEIAAQAVLGSAEKVLKSDAHPWQLIDGVCSPGGTTIEGICALEEAGFQTAIVKCLDACMAKDSVLLKK